MMAIRSKLGSVLLLAFLLNPPAFAQDLDLLGNVNWFQSGRGIRISAEQVANFGAARSGFLRLQIWATEEPYDGVSDITGYVLGTLNLGSLPGDSSFIDISRVVFYRRPPAGIYFTTMTLEEEQFDGSFVIVDFENFADPVNLGGYGAGIVEDVESTGDITFVGDIWWESGDRRVEIFAERIQNERAEGRSGVLRLRLWATTTPYEGGPTLQGWVMTTKRVGRVHAGFYIPDFNPIKSFRPPPPDDYYWVTMTLEEFVRGKWEIVDYITFPDQSLF